MPSDEKSTFLISPTFVLMLARIDLGLNVDLKK